MAIYSAGYLSPIKNKLGGAVGRRWRNLNVLASYQGNVKNPRTYNQQLNRLRLATISTIARGCQAVIRAGMTNYVAGTKTPARSFFIKENISAVTVVDTETATVDWTALKVSRGIIPTVAAGTAQFDTPLQVDLPFDVSNIATAYPSYWNKMKVYGFIYCPDEGYGILSDPTSVSIAGHTVSIMVPSLWTGMKVHCWLFTVVEEIGDNEYGWKNGDATDSVYVGSGNIS